MSAIVIESLLIILLVIDGGVPVDEFQQILCLRQIPDDEHGDNQTLAGFVLQQIGRIPVAGEQFEWRRERFEVVDMDRRRIDKMLVQPARERSVF